MGTEDLQEPGDGQLSFDLTIDSSCYNDLLVAMPHYPSAANPQTAKALGAFYTDVEIAEFLAAWAVRKKTDVVIDPSFGGAVFLRSVAKRLNAIGGIPKRQIFGVEIDKGVHARIVSMLQDEFSIERDNLISADFFDVDREALPEFDAVVGNPPFIRYQRFSGRQRHTALARAAEVGVELSELSSSWAPFLALSVALLKNGGRLAMVIPMELTYAAYARPIIAHLRRSFRRVSVLTFRKRLFPEISEDTVLLLCEDKGQEFDGIFHFDLPNSGALRTFADRSGQRLPSAQLEENSLRLSLQYVSTRVRRVYKALRDSGRFQLGQRCNIGIGYVTGGNEFFHLSRQAASQWKIPRQYLRPAVLNGRAFSGIRFSNRDLTSAMEKENAGYLLHLGDKTENPAVNAYLQHGIKRGISESYKCRSRTPWFSVPHVYEPDCFLTYMSGHSPRLIANSAGAVAPNNLHILRFRTAGASPTVLAASWLTSLAQLSAEIEGHGLGGGMLKIEPKEAARLIVPLSHGGDARSIAAIERLVRGGDFADAQQLADRIFLRKGLGLSESVCGGLREAVTILKQRRMQIH